MIQKKMCLLGTFAVGKTSLVRRYVDSMFDEKYLTTLGVKIDKAMVEVGGKEVMLMIWDLEGEDDFHTASTAYLRGASGFFLVADGTRKETLGGAMDIQRRIFKTLGEMPFILLINKSDLKNQWEVEEAAIEELEASGVDVRLTSAKLDQGVEEAFYDLARSMIELS